MKARMMLGSLSILMVVGAAFLTYVIVNDRRELGIQFERPADVPTQTATVALPANAADRDRAVLDDPAAPIDASSPQADAVPPIPESLEPASLRTAIEKTLAGRIDPGAFLDTALELSKLEISKTPYPMPDVSGAMRYPILGTPEGVTAELWVATPKSSVFGGPLLTYHVNVATPSDYMLEGVARRGLEAQISLWTDKSGNVKNYGVLTDSLVAGGRSNELGIDWKSGTYPTGALFSFDAANPLDWTAKNCIIEQGALKDADGSCAVTGAWPRLNDLGTLKEGLLRQYGTL